MRALRDGHFTSPDGRFAVSIAAGVLDRILAQCRTARGRETGGVIVGHYSEDRGTALVEGISTVPPDSRHGRFSFYRGVQGLKAWLDTLWGRGAGYYLGEWHFHPYASASPSRTDRQQMLEIAGSERYRCPEPILVVVGGNPAGKYELSVTVFTRGGVTTTLVAVCDPTIIS